MKYIRFGVVLLLALWQQQVLAQFPAHLIVQVRDEISKQPLEGVTIYLTGVDTITRATDESGNARIPVPKPGRYNVQVRYTGYASYTTEVRIVTESIVYLNISLKESATQLETVSITALPPPNAHVMSIEKALRFPGNFFDPVRIATSYPGMITANDQNNALIIRGKSPQGMLWRINGLDVINPNHLANAGTFSDKPAANGGGVTMVSAQVVDETKVYTGAFPLTYGNAQSGIVDMTFRKGNAEDHQFTAQASLLGLDVAAEGPMNERSTYLVNYRYSTVGLLGNAGVDFGDESISFQDISFQFDFNPTATFHWNVFGLAGASDNVFTAKESANREESKDWFDITYRGRQLTTGATFTKNVSERSAWEGGVAYSVAQQDRNAWLILSPDRYSVESYQHDQALVSSFLALNTKTNWGSLNAGVYVNYQRDELYDRQDALGSYFGPCATCDDYLLSGNVQGVVLQPYVSLETQLSNRISFQTGLRWMHYTFNNTSSFEPMAAATWYASPKTVVQLSYRQAARLQRERTYMISGNKNLSMTKQHLLDATWTQTFMHDLQLRLSLYYHALSDVPVNQGYSVLNDLEDTQQRVLTNSGSGTNTGVEVSLEKRLTKSIYWIGGGSVYRANYSTETIRNASSRYDGRYQVTMTWGKEWRTVNKDKFSNISIRTLYAGGLREQPIDLARAQETYQTQYIAGAGYSSDLSDYFRADLRWSTTKKRKKSIRTWSIDIQNIANIQNDAYRYYDFQQQRVVMKKQLGNIPVIAYRLQF